MAKVYEYEFGVLVKADSKEEAWKKVREISEKLDSIDYEGNSSVSGPFELELGDD